MELLDTHQAIRRQSLTRAQQNGARGCPHFVDQDHAGAQRFDRHRGGLHVIVYVRGRLPPLHWQGAIRHRSDLFGRSISDHFVIE